MLDLLAHFRTPPSAHKFAKDLEHALVGWGNEVKATEVLGYAQDWLVRMTFRSDAQAFVALDLNGPIFCPKNPIKVFTPSRLAGHGRQYRDMRAHFPSPSPRFVLVTDSRVRSEDAIAIHGYAGIDVVDGITLDVVETARRVDAALAGRNWTGL